MKRGRYKQRNETQCTYLDVGLTGSTLTVSAQRRKYTSDLVLMPPHSRVAPPRPFPSTRTGMTSLFTKIRQQNEIKTKTRKGRRQDKLRQLKTRQDNKRQHKTRQLKARQQSTTPHKTRQHNTRLDDKTTQQHKTTQDKAKQHNTSQDNTKRDNTTQLNTLKGARKYSRFAYCPENLLLS